MNNANKCTRIMGPLADVYNRLPFCRWLEIQRKTNGKDVPGFIVQKFANVKFRRPLDLIA